MGEKSLVKIQDQMSFDKGSMFDFDKILCQDLAIANSSVSQGYTWPMEMKDRLI